MTEPDPSAPVDPPEPSAQGWSSLEEVLRSSRTPSPPTETFGTTDATGAGQTAASALSDALGGASSAAPDAAPPRSTGAGSLYGDTPLGSPPESSPAAPAPSSYPAPAAPHSPPPASPYTPPPASPAASFLASRAACIPLPASRMTARATLLTTRKSTTKACARAA